MKTTNNIRAFGTENLVGALTVSAIAIATVIAAVVSLPWV